MVFEEYNAVMIPIFVTLGSLGILGPYYVEGFFIFSVVLLVVLFLLRKAFEQMGLTGYYDIFLAAISVIFALAYFQKLTLLFIISGVIILCFALYTIFVATGEIKCAS
jgi:hypothetical protein